MESFLFVCKQNYFDQITPANPLSKETDGYWNAVSIAKFYFDNNRYSDFRGYFMEGQDLISLWAAHLILEYGNPDRELQKVSIKTIIDYSPSPLVAKCCARRKRMAA